MAKAQKKNEVVEKITSYKGFSKDMTCRGMKFEIGKEYTHEGKVKACESGFHACEYPLDVFGYYPPATSIFAVVEQSGSLSREDSDSKVASSHLSIKAQISLGELINAAVDFTLSRAKTTKKGTNEEDNGAASATGWSGAASATGGSGAAALTTGQYAKASAIDDAVQSIAIGAGYMNQAKAAAGNWIVLANRNEDGEIRHLKTAQAGFTDGVKPNTWYSLNENGEFVEAAA